MNPEVKASWVAALRSGEYAQGKDALQCKGAFCCLGVLSDLHRKATGMGRWEEDARDVNSSYYAEGLDQTFSEAAILPPPVMTWAGLAVPNPHVDHVELGDMSLAEMNDSGATFEQIAEYIEQQL